MLRSLPYERRRLQLMAAARTGSSVLDLGYAEMPNPHLAHGYTVGFDLAKPDDAPGYDEQIVGDVNEVDRILAGQRFDTVLSGELIEHLERPYDHLRTLRSLVAPGGRLVLSTPNPMGFPVVGLEWLRSRRWFYTEDHLYYFPPRWVVRMLERTGYDVRSVRGVGLWLPGAVIPSVPVGLSYQVIYTATPRD